MPKLAISAFAALTFLSVPAISGEAEVKSAQSTIERQLNAFSVDDNALAYSFAAPNIKRMFPNVERFMGMVRNG